MDLRTALTLCTVDRGDDWVLVPGQRPATTMLASHFDPGMREPQTRAIAPNHVAVHVADPSLSIAWLIDEDDSDLVDHRERYKPDWFESVGPDFRSATTGWSVVLLGGAPVWQVPLYYLDWGSGVGGYVPHFRPVFAESDELSPVLTGWSATRWEMDHANLLSGLTRSASTWWSVNPSTALVPGPSSVHPVDEALGRR